jgi:hypothetical protein
MIETTGDLEVVDIGRQDPTHDSEVGFRMTRSADSVQPGVLVQLVEPNQE